MSKAEQKQEHTRSYYAATRNDTRTWPALEGEVDGGWSELREPFSVTRPRRFNDELYRSALSA